MMGQSSPISISGVVMDSLHKEFIPYASIGVFDSKTNHLISGTTSDFNGKFSLKSDSADVCLAISFMGYKTKRICGLSIINDKVNLGSILLSTAGLDLEAVEIEAERSTTEFKLDKRVFNVGKDLSSTGASAMEVLNNVPSVNVSIEGDISLRGNSGVQILINGKPSVLASEQGNALGTITADMIEKIEVITNPSAKYQAEGTSGIINIVLKKEEKKGVNGSISVNTGLPHNHSLGFSLNRRTEKFNLFTQLGAGYRSLPQYSRNINEDKISGNTISSQGTEYRNEQFYNFILGTDYYINETNILTLSGSVALEVEDQPSTTNFELRDSLENLVSDWQRTEKTSAINPKYQYELKYKSDFKDHEDHTLLLGALGSFFGKDQSSQFENNSFSDTYPTTNQRTRTNFQETNYTFSADYTKPFKKKFKLESGAQYVRQQVSNDFAVSNFVGSKWVDDASLTNVFDYNQNVFGGYSTVSYEGDTFGIKLGLRVENTDLSTLLVNTNQTNNLNYTNLFPSAHVSYKINERLSLQSGYSRRIYRPRLWDLNPFFNIRNNFNIRTGNPNLLPEFTDSYELQGIYMHRKISINAGLFYLYTTDVIERISTFSNGVNTTMPVNLGIKHATGLEFNTKWNMKKWMILSGDLNVNRFQRIANLEGRSIDFSATRWTTKWTLRLKLPKDFETEVTGHYESGFRTVQGSVKEQLFADAGVRKKFMKGKAVLNLSVRDIFASRIRVNVTDQANFYVYDRGYRGRFITLGFSYGFGKGEAMEFSGARRHR
jgi:outer membrane receptor protein involved in Fe transport